jgi:hypothetical protein
MAGVRAGAVRLYGRFATVLVLCLAVVFLLLALTASRALAAGSPSGGQGGGQGPGGLAAAGAVRAPAAPVPFGMGGGGPALAGHGADSPAPSASSTKSTANASLLSATGGTNTPGAPTNLSESPWDQSAVESTTPTLSATYNNAGSYTGYVQFEVLSYSGTVLATGQGTTVNPGAVSTWNYPMTAPPLQVGSEYKVQAVGVGVLELGL